MPCHGHQIAAKTIYGASVRAALSGPGNDRRQRDGRTRDKVAGAAAIHAVKSVNNPVENRPIYGLFRDLSC